MGGTRQVQQLQRHAVALEDFDFDHGLGMLAATQKLINAHRGALAVGDAVDDQPRAEDAIATAKDPVRRGHQGLRVHRDQSARRQFDAVFRFEEVQLRRLADRHNNGVALQLRFTALVKRRIETLILIEDPFRLQRFERHDLCRLCRSCAWDRGQDA